ncbi:glutamate--tRNA ligase [Candidatus Saccharibacteria bacterium]|nr:glutamate--tRNA ligase [Candidatus Saccharibacteria bacterium]
MVRTRFAPSPTGYIHVGNARSALYPFLIARQNKGQFILRIEDTDQSRFVQGAEDLIYDTLNWLGLNWDEGPYYQTQRKDIYLKWANKLIAKGLAYADPYSPEQVEEFRESAKAAKKPFLFRDHRPENPPTWDGSQPLRFKVTDLKRYHWHDEVMGDLSAGSESLDDFILIKSDGLPTYNFAHIVDDYEMKITHVIRGQEYISSMPKYLSLYEALDITPPIFAHVPHILAPTGNKKLGKRDGAKSVTEYRSEGILPEAMVNFLAQLGWNDGTEQEIYTMDELISKFSLGKVQKSGARFDEQRLLWLNGQWIRHLDLDDLYRRTVSSLTATLGRSASPPSRVSSLKTRRDSNSPKMAVSEDTSKYDFWGPAAQKASDTERKKVLAITQDRLKTLADLPSLTEYFFTEPQPNWPMIDDNKQLSKLSRAEQIKLLETAKTDLAEADFDSLESLQDNLNKLLEKTGQKPAILFSLIRFALTWAPFSPGLPETMQVLGKDNTLQRLQAAINFAQN